MFFQRGRGRKKHVFGVVSVEYLMSVGGPNVCMVSGRTDPSKWVPARDRPQDTRPFWSRPDKLNLYAVWPFVLIATRRHKASQTVALSWFEQQQRTVMRRATSVPRRTVTLILISECERPKSLRNKTILLTLKRPKHTYLSSCVMPHS